jgi:sugar/nucleoside kinase (ribokinase family)
VRYDVVGIGNALVDIIAHAADSFIGEHDLVKGSMTLIDTDRALAIYRALGTAIQMSGGSAANTVCGVASLGGRAAYIGKVNRDDLGEVFGHDMRAVGVRFRAGRYDHDLPTGRCVIVVTPDAQRTMNTYLGMSSMLGPDDLDETIIAAGAILYMEGYLFDRDEAKAAFRRAAEVAHQHGRLVSLTLSDSFCVDRHRTDFRALVSDQVDLLFGNEAELIALYETDTLDEAVEAVRAECALTVITVGAKGCLIATADDVTAVAAAEVDHVLDTTGAGDLFAAGFLFGHSRGMSLEESARIGSIAAGEVISHVGPRPLVRLSSLV